MDPGVIELLVLGHVEQQPDAGAIEERQFGGRGEEEAEPKRIAVEAHGSVEIAGVHRDLADTGEAAVEVWHQS